MATNVTIEFAHSLYGTFEYLRGQAPDVDEERLRALLVGADNALNRGNGFFFDTIDGQFIFGFEVQRDDSLSRHGSMAYFDVYTAPLEQVHPLYLPDIRDYLAHRRITSHDTEVQKEITFEISDVADFGRKRSNSTDQVNERADPALHATRDEEESHRGDHSEECPCDEASHTDRSGHSGNFTHEELSLVAELWEQYRRKELPIRASLNEVVRFTCLVKGSLPHISFVSDDRADPSYFFAVPGSRRQSFAAEMLLDQLASAAADGSLQWNQLPTYEDEWARVKQTHRERLVEEGQYPDLLGDVFVEAHEEAEQIMENHCREVELIYERYLEAAIKRSESNSSSGRMFGSLGEILSLDSGANYQDVVSDIDTKRVDDEVKTAVAEQIVTEATRDAAEEIALYVESELKRRLVETFEEGGKTLARETVVQLNEAKSSKAYRALRERDLAEDN